MFGPARRNPRAGVTLLELLLSLTLMVAMALAMAAVLGLTGRAALRIGAAGSTTDLLLARYTLRSWIEAAPRTAPFAGSPEALSFQMLTDEPPFSAAEPATVDLSLDADGAVVVKTTAPGDEGATRQLTLSSAGGLQLSYFGRIDPLAAPAWHSDWPAPAGLPDLVRIDYDGPEGGLPPLVAIPALVARQSEMSLSSPPPPG